MSQLDIPDGFISSKSNTIARLGVTETQLQSIIIDKLILEIIESML